MLSFKVFDTYFQIYHFKKLLEFLPSPCCMRVRFSSLVFFWNDLTSNKPNELFLGRRMGCQCNLLSSVMWKVKMHTPVIVIANVYQVFLQHFISIKSLDLHKTLMLQMTTPWKWTYQQLSILESQQVRFVSVGPKTLGHRAELPVSWACMIGILIGIRVLFTFLISVLK